MERFHQYTYGRLIKVYQLYTICHWRQHPNVSRMLLRLQLYNFYTTYKPDKLLYLAGALSKVYERQNKSEQGQYS